MAKELIINASLPETRIVLMEDGELQEIYIDRTNEETIVGNIYKGKVTRVLPGMQAAFVDIGLDKAAFLYVDDVYSHPEIFDDAEDGDVSVVEPGDETEEPVEAAEAASDSSSDSDEIEDAEIVETEEGEAAAVAGEESTEVDSVDAAEVSNADAEGDAEVEVGDDDDFEEDESDDEGPVSMGAENDDEPVIASTVAEPGNEAEPKKATASEDGNSSSAEAASGEEGGEKRRRSRGRRGDRSRRGRGRRGGRGRDQDQAGKDLPGAYQDQMTENVDLETDRASLSVEESGDTDEVVRDNRRSSRSNRRNSRNDFRQKRGRDRRIRTRMSAKPRQTAKIEDLLQEGQEVVVQIAKDPIATKGARLTCHISLAGRNLVCMPTINHVGVSRRIERDDDRRRLREVVETNRPKDMGFIVRTASGKQSEQRILQDIEYLSSVWNEIREKATEASAPALVYQDLNPVLRAIRDWVNEDIDKIVVDMKEVHNEVLEFVGRFMPQSKDSVDLYHGDIPIFDAYGISSVLSRALERRVWLKSGGYIVIDQAEALVAIDVNTGRFVGKRSLEDTILKTNLEAVEEVAYQLRLRNLGGIIIIDLIDMEKEENRRRVYRALEEAIKRDRARPTIQKISELGLVEMTRKRTRDSMIRTLCEPCSYCEGKGFHKNKETVAYEALRDLERMMMEGDFRQVLVQAHPEVVDVLAIEYREVLDQIENRYRKKVLLQGVVEFHREQFNLEGDRAPGKRQTAAQQINAKARRGGDRDRSDRNDRSDRGGRKRSSSGKRSGKKRSTSNRNGNEGNASKKEVGSNGNVASKPNGRTASADDNVGNRAAPAHVAPAASSPVDKMEEEDRLAFLRAQAAQDAALANLSSHNNGPSPSVAPRAAKRSRGGGRGGRGGRRGGGGGNSARR